MKRYHWGLGGANTVLSAAKDPIFVTLRKFGRSRPKQVTITHPGYGARILQLPKSE
jgi:hypothetical protein